MKVKELIRQLEQFDPEARVYTSSYMGEGRNEILCCISYRHNGDVIVEDATEFDVGNEIGVMFDYFYEDGVDETDAYTEMCDRGYTPDVVSEYYNMDVGKHMKEYCDEHGIDY